MAANLDLVNNLFVHESDDEEDSDISEGDEDDMGTTEGRGSKRFKYREGLQLPEGVTKPCTIEDLNERIESGEIDLNPEYQREVVWSSNQMSKLIDSLFDKYYIPPVIFNSIPDPDDNTRIVKYTCVDGKQRLSSVFEFIRGNIPCTSKDGTKWYYCESSGNPRKKNILPEVVRKEFLQKSYLCCMYKGLSRQQEEDLFQRVQKGVPLNAREKLRAVDGIWQRFTRACEIEFEDIMQLIGTKIKRAGGFKTFLVTFMIIFELDSPTGLDGVSPVLQTQTAQIELFCKVTEACTPETKAKIRKVFEMFRTLHNQSTGTFEDEAKPRYSKGFHPLEFVAVSALLYKWKDSRTTELLIGDVAGLRSHLRKKAKDTLRLSKAHWKFAWDYIDHLGRYRGHTDDVVPVRPAIATETNDGGEVVVAEEHAATLPQETDEAATSPEPVQRADSLVESVVEQPNVTSHERKRTTPEEFTPDERPPKQRVVGVKEEAQDHVATAIEQTPLAPAPPAAPVRAANTAVVLGAAPRYNFRRASRAPQA